MCRTSAACPDSPRHGGTTHNYGVAREIVKAYLAAQSGGDAAGALDFLTDDAVQEAAAPDACATPSPCVGNHDIEASFLGRIVRGHPELTPVDQVVAEDRVTTRVEV